MIREFIEEAEQTDHYTKRVFDRLVYVDKITVGYEISGTYGRYEEVGTYVLPQELKNKIIENSKVVENYNFPKNKSYAVKISDIPIDNSKINYFSEEYKQYVLTKRPVILFLDSMTESNGNQLYAVVRDNKIVTAFFAKSYSMKDVKDKMRVDAFVKDI